jgi:hypothetical protein
VKVGDVCIIRTTMTRPPKDKIVLCCCVADGLFLWINSEARKHGVGQMPLVQTDIPSVLSHDSVLDCSRLTTFLPKELAMARHRASISGGLAGRIIDYLEKTRPKTLPPRHLRLIIENLSTLL